MKDGTAPRLFDSLHSDERLRPDQAEALDLLIHFISFDIEDDPDAYLENCLVPGGGE